jgi:hypothetical protein
MKNIACNLIYNNGGEGSHVGFTGLCSIDNIIYNVENGQGRWCSQPGCACRKYYDSGFKKHKMEFPCNESRTFTDWEWNPGNEYKTGQPFRILNSGANKIAIMTTRFPNSNEAERKIVGFFLIKSLTDNHEIVANRKESLRLTIDEAKELNFWNYYRNSKSATPEWKQGRFRYLEDINVAAILHDLRDVVQDSGTRYMISSIISNYLREHADSRPNVESALKENFQKKILLIRKYGKGGESIAHKELKMHISLNPQLLGISRGSVKPFVEHSFVSGDMVDILFEPIEGTQNTVVEIELDNVLPGIHQAIKYRVLRCSQLGLPITAINVHATVVAWKLSRDEKALCEKYGVKYLEYKL